MAGLKITASFTQGMALIRRLSDKGTVEKPADDGVKRIAIKLEAEAKKATVVDTGRLRASITHKLFSRGAQVGSNVAYASFIEYGTSKMKARHMEGTAKVLGTGMLAYGLKVLKDWVTKQGDVIARQIAERIKYGN